MGEAKIATKLLGAFNLFDLGYAALAFMDAYLIYKAGGGCGERNAGLPGRFLSAGWLGPPVGIQWGMARISHKGDCSGFVCGDFGSRHRKKPINHVRRGCWYSWGPATV